MHDERSSGRTILKNDRGSLRIIETVSPSSSSGFESSVEGCRKGAKFAAQAAFSAIIGKLSCLFSLALEFSTRFRGVWFQPLTHLSAAMASRLQLILSGENCRYTSLPSSARSGEPAKMLARLMCAKACLSRL